MTGSPADVLRWLRDEARFAQLVTVDRDGFPVARTVGAPVNDDWSVDLVQRRSHRRLAQLRDNPRLEIIWVGTPAPGSRNDRPAVFDYGWLAPRAVFLRGVAQFMDDEWTLARYRQLSGVLRARGGTRAPRRDLDDVRAELVGVHVRPVRVRAEGFGGAPGAVTWRIEDLS